MLPAVREQSPTHWTFHRTRPAAGANIKAPEAEFAAYGLAVFIFCLRDRMPAPTDYAGQLVAAIEHLRVAKDLEN